MKVTVKFRAANPALAKQPQRTTSAWPLFYSLFGGIRKTDRRAIPKPTPYNLRRFAERPVCRAAINRIKDPICALKWHIVPLEGLEMTDDMARRARIVANCLRTPNKIVTGFRGFLEPLVDDTLTVAGAAEIVLTPEQPEHPGWLFPVDGATIRVYPNWSGDDPDEARYAQFDLYDQQ
ncbi:MAG: hypothetical protein KGR26_10865, partial [Cyanobacteria bacterium REEB65]|nr:hypothetical protein [Cyanobacteria bacterium REEB65]